MFSKYLTADSALRHQTSEETNTLPSFPSMSDENAFTYPELLSIHYPLLVSVSESSPPSLRLHTDLIYMAFSSPSGGEQRPHLLTKPTCDVPAPAGSKCILLIPQQVIIKDWEAPTRILNDSCQYHYYFSHLQTNPHTHLLIHYAAWQHRLYFLTTN